jgi:hypothetical protein
VKALASFKSFRGGPKASEKARRQAAGERLRPDAVLPVHGRG